MSKLSGHIWKSSSRIDDYIDSCVKEVLDANASITGPREPNPELSEHNQKYMDEIATSRGRPLFYPYLGTGSGRGPYVELEDGSVKMDLINGIGINIFGHSHPKLLKAGVKGALEDAVMQGNLQPNRQYHELLKKLVDLCGQNTKLRHAWITTSGSMANENALKICRQKTSPRSKIIAMNAAFAGRTTLMAEITDNPSYKQGLPDYNDVLRIDFYNPNNPNSAEHSLKQFKELLEKYPDQIGCFTFEPMQGEGGYNVAPREFFLPMLELCREHKIAVWADEVQTFLRTGEALAIQTLDIADYVDVVSVAKTLQAGASLYSEEYNPKPGLIAGTFAGASASLSAAIAVLDEMTENMYFGPNGRIAEIHKGFCQRIEKLMQTTCKGHIHSIGGLGLMVAMHAHDGSKEKMMELLKVLYRNGLMTFGCGRGPFKVRFLLPAILSEHDLDVAAEIIEKSVLELA